MSPSMYSLILDECDELARDYAMGIKPTEIQYMKKND